jgi:hypothetical protein
MVGRDPRRETRLGSIGVVTLDPPERSIGSRLGAGGVVGTKVDVAVRYEAWASRIVPLWATTVSAKVQEPSPSGLLLGRWLREAGLVAVGEGRVLRPVASLGIEVGWTSAGQADWSARTGTASGQAAAQVSCS